MGSSFQEVAPYLKDPLVLIGFFLFVSLLITRTLLTQKLLKPLPPTLSYRILRSILLYGFIIGLLVIILGFALKHQEIADQKKTVASLEKMLGDALQSATGMAEEKKKEIIEQFLIAYRSKAMSKEQIEKRAGEIKNATTYNVSYPSENTSFQPQPIATPDKLKIDLKPESPFSLTPTSIEPKNSVANETRIDKQSTGSTSEKVEGLNTGVLLPHSKPLSKTSGVNISGGMPQTGEQFRVTITYPPDEKGVKVGKEITVKGTASIPSDNHLWVLVRRADLYVWWPQDEGKIDVKTEEWKVNVVFGNARDIGDEFDIAVITVDTKVHMKLLDHWKKGMEYNGPPIDMPPTTSMVLRKVTKVTHN